MQTAASRATAARGPGRRQGCRARRSAGTAHVLPGPSCVGFRGAIAAAHVEHLDHNADRAARIRARGARRHDKKPLNNTCSKLVGKWLLLHTCSALRRCKCVGASCSYPTAANRSSELTNGFAIKNMMYDANAGMLIQVEIVKHGGVHGHELHRARRHVDRERRPHAKRRREQGQRRRGEDGRRKDGARFLPRRKLWTPQRRGSSFL